MITMKDIPATVANIYHPHPDTICVNAGAPGFCAAGSSVHPDSHDQQCSQCEMSGAQHSAWEALREMTRCMFDDTAFEAAKIARAEAESEARAWGERYRKDVHERHYQPEITVKIERLAPYPFMRKMGRI